ncbi:MAG: hypothetical protein UW24_C0024G0009 [Parcubacteria group bacterium GW2011_GWA2_44_12]|nr:MAG: hypothetical protein UW24_C0024G0009 [Parcubacteria group bacterium GW2011_GWA2_44_12]
MFDDITPKQNSQPAQEPHEEDVFADDLELQNADAAGNAPKTETAKTRIPQPQKGDPASFQAAPQGGAHYSASAYAQPVVPFAPPLKSDVSVRLPMVYGRRRLVVFVLSQIVLTLLIIIGILSYKLLSSSQVPAQPKNDFRTEPVEVPPQEPVQELENAQNKVPDEPASAKEEAVPLPPPSPPSSLDTDTDGLTDEEELSLGTNPRVPDTDFDGLGDFEEVKIYHTNPALKDTDGDSYLDGNEVKDGFDPAVAGGKLKK